MLPVSICGKYSTRVGSTHTLELRHCVLLLRTNSLLLVSDLGEIEREQVGVLGMGHKLRAFITVIQSHSCELVQHCFCFAWSIVNGRVSSRLPPSPLFQGFGGPILYHVVGVPTPLR